MSAPKPARPIAIHLRPFRSSHLCFEVDGILSTLSVDLGESVVPFDLPAFCAGMRAGKTVLSDKSRLLYNFSEIEAAIKNLTQPGKAPYLLATLRNEIQKTALNQAINARQNAYFAKYGNATDIIAFMNMYYSPSVAHSKPNRLANLATLSASQTNALKLAYTNDKVGVVKHTVSTINSATRSVGASSSTGRSETFTASTPVEGDGHIMWAPSTNATDLGVIENNDVYGESDSFSSNREGTTSSGEAVEFQAITNTDYAYRVPSIECSAQNERAQISLIDERFADFMENQDLPHLNTVFRNELDSIDSDVYRLQIALVNSFLTSPISGTVTGIYKYPGDAVKAGEPVVRIEDSSTVFLLVSVVYRAPIVVGSKVKIATSRFGSSGAKTKINGTAVSVRGHRNDDRWALVVKCNNVDVSGKPILPLDYHFDFDDTTISIN